MDKHLYDPSCKCETCRSRFPRRREYVGYCWGGPQHGNLRSAKIRRFDFAHFDLETLDDGLPYITYKIHRYVYKYVEYRNHWWGVWIVEGDEAEQFVNHIFNGLNFIRFLCELLAGAKHVRPADKIVYT